MVPKGVSYSSNPIVAHMQQLCGNREYVESLAFMEQTMNQLEGADLGELYLIRAQIKMFACDETMLDDLKTAKKLLPNGGMLTSIETNFASGSIGLFAAFNTGSGSISRFKVALQKSEPLLRRLFGGNSANLAYALEADILYHTGYIDKALLVAKPVYRRMVATNSYYMAMVTGFTLIQCYVAQANLLQVKQISNQLTHYSRILSQPLLKEIHKGMQDWLDCTTGWMGQYPRFLCTPDGAEHCVLDGRIRVMLGSTSDLYKFESAVVGAARYSVPNAVAMKDLYTNIYYAMVLYKLGLRERAVSIFYEQYESTHKNRIIMAFAEYGKQILPLLQYAVSRPDGSRFSRRWSDKLNQLATQYEESLCVIRGEYTTASIIEEEFTPLEMDILRELVNNRTIAQASATVHITVLDAKEQIRSIYRKLSVHNRTEAAAKAIGARIIIPGLA